MTSPAAARAARSAAAAKGAGVARERGGDGEPARGGRVVAHEVERLQEAHARGVGVVEPHQVDAALLAQQARALGGLGAGADLGVEELEHHREAPGAREDPPAGAQGRDVRRIGGVGALVVAHRGAVVAELTLVDAADLVAERGAASGVDAGADLAAVELDRRAEPVEALGIGLGELVDRRRPVAVAGEPFFEPAVVDAALVAQCVPPEAPAGRRGLDSTRIRRRCRRSRRAQWMVGGRPS
ncbi:MAG: hypothetical protein H6701_10110 [Myxococcales bacterium]|nr:hypothetical protein [Myxococcales bacterium]